MSASPMQGEASDRHQDEAEIDDQTMAGEAVREKSVPIAQEPPEYELNQLRRLNREKADLIDGEGKAVQWLFNLSEEFINGCNGERLYHLVRTWDAQVVIKDLQADFCQFFAGRTTEEVFVINGRHVQAQYYYTLALELLALGVISHPNVNRKIPYHSLPTHFRRAISDLNHVVNTIVQAYVDQETKNQEKIINEAYERRCGNFENFSAHKEDDPDLAPAEKARVFMNALVHRNGCGWLVLHRENENYPSIPVFTSEVRRFLIFHMRDRDLFEQFFEDHTKITVSDLLWMVEDCVNVFLDADEVEGKDDLWHARQGRNIPFLLRNVQKTAKELDMVKGTNHSEKVRR